MERETHSRCGTRDRPPSTKQSSSPSTTPAQHPRSPSLPEHIQKWRRQHGAPQICKPIPRAYLFARCRPVNHVYLYFILIVVRLSAVQYLLPRTQPSPPRRRCLCIRPPFQSVFTSAHQQPHPPSTSPTARGQHADAVYPFIARRNCVKPSARSPAMATDVEVRFPFSPHSPSFRRNVPRRSRIPSVHHIVYTDNVTAASA